MVSLRDLLGAHVDAGAVPGAVALVSRPGRVELAAVGSVDVADSAPMTEDTIFRIASVTKVITAAAVMVLVDEGRLALTDPVQRWLPELADRVVVRTPAAAVDDVVPATRPITVVDLLTSRAGYGFPADFSRPAVGALLEAVEGHALQPQELPAPDDWLAALSGVPLLHQPGAGWLHNTCYDILGVLVARVARRSLPEFLTDRLFTPLRLTDTAFAVPAGDLDRFTSCYRSGAGGLELIDGPTGQWSRPPAFPSGAGGLVSTVGDLAGFLRMLLAGGSGAGRRVLSPGSVAAMTTDHLTESERGEGQVFLDGQGWGFGGSVDVAAVDAWNAPGRYGWIGGTGTAAHLVPSTGAVTVVLSQRAMTGPTAPELMADVWRYAAAG